MTLASESPEPTPLQRAVRHRAVNSSRYARLSTEELLLELYRVEKEVNRQTNEFKRAALEARQSRQARQTAESRLRQQKIQLDLQIARAEKFKSAYEKLKSASHVRIARAVSAPMRRARRLGEKPVQIDVATPQLPDKPEPGAQPPVASASKVGLRTREAKSKYFAEGSITDAMQLVGDLTETPQGHDVVFLRQLAGSARLLESLPSVPPRQPNLGYFPKNGRVLYCAHSTGGFNSNGYSTRTAGLVRAMSDGGDVVVVARPGYPWDAKTTSTPGRKTRFEQTIDGTRHVFNPGPSLREDALDLYIQHSVDIIVREATIHRASLIQAASNHVTALPALIAARRLGVPFVYEVRGLWEVTEISNKPHWADTERFRLAARAESLVASEADEVLAITSQVRDELVRRGSSAERITLLPNAADPFEFVPLPPDSAIIKRLGKGPEDIFVGYAGSILEYEGVDLLVQAFALAHQTCPALKLLIVGDGPALPGVRARVSELGLADHAIFTGRVAAGEVPKYLTAMDIVVCPRVSTAVTEMVSPLKPLEAMSAGRAVITSDVAPLRDLIGRDGVRGALFEAGNPRPFADAMTSLGADSERRADMGRAARKWVLENRTWTSMARRVQERHAAVHDRLQYTKSTGKSLNDLTLALVSDEFTRKSIESECRLVLPSLESWKQDLAVEKIDALLIESAWEGNGGSWRGHVGYYDDESFGALKAMVQYCRSRGIPTIFWNKEDPVHFNRFRLTAKLFDHVFTTDGDRIPAYFAHRGQHCRTIGSLPFWAQARLHNPLPVEAGSDQTVAYGGTYYGNRYPQRSAELASLLEALKPFGVSIYDRQANLPDSPYHFPEELRENVRGGLTYAEMLQAYKSHPVHLNVNSVFDSPTMFSRRVVELAACGTPVISGAGRGVTTLFGDLVPTPKNAEETALLGALWMEDERERNNDAWRLHRYAFRAHMAAHRLSYMLRTAGMVVAVPELRSYALEVAKFDESTVGDVLGQTHRPRVVHALAVDGEIGQESLIRLHSAGIQVVSHGTELPDGLARIFLGDASVDCNAAEDLCRASEFTDGPVQLFDGDLNERGLTLWDFRPADRDAPLLKPSAEEDSLPVGVLSLRRAVKANSSVESNREKDRSNIEVLSESRRVLVAGHDLKFAGGIMSWLRDRGHEVVTDVWDDHSRHDVRHSESLLANADVVFCEWSLGNVEWYAANRRHQRLTSRFHSQELFTPHLKRLDVNLVDQTIFVGEFVRQVAVRRFGYDASRTVVVPNAIGVPLQSHDSDERRRHTLGLVGMVPRQKHLDRAVEILARLRETEPKFELRIKGRRPQEFPWMQNRPEELRYYEDLEQRVSEDPRLRGAVHFDAHGNDMADWYARVGVVLSVSDFESFHLTLADGAASGALPVSLEWPGANLIYPEPWLHPNLDAMTRRIADVAVNEDMFADETAAATAFVAKNFKPETVNAALGAAILGG